MSLHVEIDPDGEAHIQGEHEWASGADSENSPRQT
jgi:hypothetical protein